MRMSNFSSNQLFLNTIIIFVGLRGVMNRNRITKNEISA